MQSLRTELLSLCSGFKGDVGISVAAHGQTMSIRGDEQFPLMSLVKVPVAAAALDVCRQRGATPEELHSIKFSQLDANTYSPLRSDMERYAQSDTTLTLKQIVNYAVAMSDNNMCDFLIAYCGGIEQIDSWWRSKALSHFQFTETEATMHQDVLRSRNNRATPTAVITMLQQLFAPPYALSLSDSQLLRSIMEASPTGAGKLKAGLPADVRFAHKTGLSDRLADGLLIASTDAGVMRLPSGEDCYIAVLVKDTKEDNAATDRLMADIARCAWRHLASSQSAIAIRNSVEQLMSSYPEARLQDIYKSFYQDRFGPGHLLADTARAKRYLEKELEESGAFDADLYEPTGWRHQFYRVDLAAVTSGMVDKEAYFDAFYRSTLAVPPFSVDQWRREWQQVVKAVSQSPRRPMGFEADSIWIDSMMQARPTAVHHSEAFRQAYHPHYRIIAKDIFEQELLPLLSPQSPTELIDNRISPTTLIITYDSPKAKKRLLKALKEIKATVVYDYNILPGMAIKKPADMTLQATKALLEQVKGVISVEYDHIMQLH